MSKKKKNKKHDIDWLIKCLTDAKARGINHFSFHEGNGMHPSCPEIDEIGVSNLTGVTIYLKSSEWDAKQIEREKAEQKEDFTNKKYKRMLEIWSNSSNDVRIRFVRRLLEYFSSQMLLTDKESKEFEMILKTKNKK